MTRAPIPTRPRRDRRPLALGAALVVVIFAVVAVGLLAARPSVNRTPTDADVYVVAAAETSFNRSPFLSEVAAEAQQRGVQVTFTVSVDEPPARGRA